MNRFVRGDSQDKDAAEALSSFKRFPTWMWRNADVRDFAGWIRRHNDAVPAGKPKVGFYGLDLYSLFESAGAVLKYLQKVDPEAAKRAQHRYSCFDHFSEDVQRYGYAASLGLSESCEHEVIEQLIELRRKAAEYAQRDGRAASDEFFFAEQNARLVKNAERYYRAMFQGRVCSWNLRDQHMAETLDSLLNHLKRRDGHAKIVVWAHNSHLGDARATEMSKSGELNVGQVARQRHGEDAVLVGFTTYAGTVTAASEWDGPAERKRVRPALANSYEALFHEINIPSFMLLLNDGGRSFTEVPEPLLERAIGVIYAPRTERMSHYFEASLGRQFDAVLHFDVTGAVEPLERTPEWETGEWETYPYGV